MYVRAGEMNSFRESGGKFDYVVIDVASGQ